MAVPCPPQSSASKGLSPALAATQPQASALQPPAGTAPKQATSTSVVYDLASDEDITTTAPQTAATPTGPEVREPAALTKGSTSRRGGTGRGLFFMVNKHTDYVCLLRDADGEQPIGINLPLAVLRPSSMKETAADIVARLKPALQVCSLAALDLLWWQSKPRTRPSVSVPTAGPSCTQTCAGLGRHGTGHNGSVQSSVGRRLQYGLVQC